MVYRNAADRRNELESPYRLYFVIIQSGMVYRNAADRCNELESPYRLYFVII